MFTMIHDVVKSSDLKRIHLLKFVACYYVVNLFSLFN